MLMTNLMPVSLRTLPRDAAILFLTRFTRLFAYGALSVVLVFYLVSLGITETQVGLLLTLTLAGDMAISLLLTTRADRIGRRRMLIVGAVLMVGAGIVFASTKNLLFLIVAGTIGVISPSGHEVGPFLSIEQAALSHVVPARGRTEVFAWYTLAGSLAAQPPRWRRGFRSQRRIVTGSSSFCTPHLALRSPSFSRACLLPPKSIHPPRQRAECPKETFLGSDARDRLF